MRLEDAFLCMNVDRPLDDGLLASWCREAIAGGVDVILLSDAIAVESDARAARAVCREDDALFILGADSESAASLDADGVHLDSPEDEVGQARAVVGFDKLVGVSASSVDEGKLGLAVGVDLLLLDVGVGPTAFQAIRSASSMPLYASGLAGIDEAAEVVGWGVYRLCVNASALADGDVTEQMAAYSRLLGRSI
jgi:thiamine-phosphate pyrophosphorylase